MKFKEYQEAAQRTAVYPSHEYMRSVSYTALGLNGEAGEIANIIKKSVRGDNPPEYYTDKIVDEMGDCLWYLSAMADVLGITLEHVAVQNLQKLHRRKHEGTLRERVESNDPLPSLQVTEDTNASE